MQEQDSFVHKNSILLYLKEQGKIPNFKELARKTGFSPSYFYGIKNMGIKQETIDLLESEYNITSEIFNDKHFKNEYIEKIKINKMIEFYRNQKIINSANIEKNKYIFNKIKHYKYLYSIDFNKNYKTYKEETIKKYNIEYKGEEEIFFFIFEEKTHNSKLYIDDKAITFIASNISKNYTVFISLLRGEIEKELIVGRITGYKGDKDKNFYSIFSKKEIEKEKAFFILNPFNQNNREIDIENMRDTINSRIEQYLNNQIIKYHYPLDGKWYMYGNGSNNILHFATFWIEGDSIDITLHSHNNRKYQGVVQRFYEEILLCTDLATIRFKKYDENKSIKIISLISDQHHGNGKAIMIFAILSRFKMEKKDREKIFSTLVDRKSSSYDKALFNLSLSVDEVLRDMIFEYEGEYSDVGRITNTK